MMAVQPRSTDDLLDILLALSISSVSHLGGIRHDNERHHVVGTNDEPHSIASSFFAKRTA